MRARATTVRSPGRARARARGRAHRHTRSVTLELSHARALSHSPRLSRSHAHGRPCTLAHTLTETLTHQASRFSRSDARQPWASPAHARQRGRAGGGLGRPEARCRARWPPQGKGFRDGPWGSADFCRVTGHGRSRPSQDFPLYARLYFSFWSAKIPPQPRAAAPWTAPPHSARDAAPGHCESPEKALLNSPSTSLQNLFPCMRGGLCG